VRKRKEVKRMNLNKATIVIVLTLFLTSTLFNIVPAAVQAPEPPIMTTFKVEPSTSTGGIGDPVPIAVNVYDAEDLWGWQVYMSWDPTVLGFTALTFGDFLADQPDGTSQMDYVSDGWLMASETTFGTYPGVTADSGWLMSVDFEVVGEGETAIDIDSEYTFWQDSALEVYGDEPDEMIKENGYFTTGAAPEPPVASFTFSPSSPDVGETVTFDASGSFDPDGTIVSWDWDFGDGASDSGEVVTHAYSAAGTYTVTLMVTDDDDLADTATDEVTVSAVEPTFDLTISVDGFGSTDPAPGVYTYDEGTMVLVTAIPDAGWMLWRWLLDGVNVGDANSYTVTMDADHALTAVFNKTKLYVDPAIVYALPGESFTVDIRVANVERLHLWQVNFSWNPTVLSFINVTEGDFLRKEGAETIGMKDLEGVEDGWALFSWGILGKYYVSGSGVLATVEFEVLTTGESVLDIDTEPTGPSGLVMTFLIKMNPDPVPPGQPELEEIPFEAVDGFFTNLLTPPVADFAYSPIEPYVNETVTFDASGSHDPDGTIVSYEWDFGDGSTDTGMIVTHAYETGGNYVVTLTVTDDDALTDAATDDVVVMIPAATQIYIDPSTVMANPGDYFTFNVSIADVTDLFAWGFKLGWPIGLLEANAANITEGPFLKQGGTTAFAKKVFTDYIDVGCSLLGANPGVSGSGVLATVTLTVLKTGNATLDLYSTKLLDPTLTEIAHMSQDGYFYTTWPVPDFTYSPNPIDDPGHPIVGETITFDASPSYDPDGGAIVLYEWDFGDGASDTGQVVTHAYDTEGSYSVTLTVTDDDGETYDVSLSILILTPEMADEYFSSVVYTPFDSDGDSFDDALEVQMDVDTTDGTLWVYVDAFLVDPYGSIIDVDFPGWEITGNSVEYGYAYLYVPSGSPEGWYDVELILYDQWWNYEDYKYGNDVLYYVPSPPSIFFFNAYLSDYVDVDDDGYYRSVTAYWDADVDDYVYVDVYVEIWGVDAAGSWSYLGSYGPYTIYNWESDYQSFIIDAVPYRDLWDIRLELYDWDTLSLQDDRWFEDVPLEPLSDDQAEWDVVLTATIEDHCDVSEFGMRSDATDEFDIAYDAVDPPEPPGSGIVSYFWYPDNPVAPVDLRRLCTSKIPPSPLMTWTYRVKPKGVRGSMVISWSAEAIAIIPPEQGVYLQCPDGSVIDMRAVTDYYFTVESDITYEFTIDVGPCYCELPLSAGWNLVSFPCLPLEDLSFSYILRDVPFYQVLTWDGTSYIEPTHVELGKGYWLLVIEEATVEYWGLPAQRYELDLPVGWSLIGSVSCMVDVDPVFPGFYQLYGWDGAGYFPSTTVEPWRGYWVLVLEPTHIVVECGSATEVIYTGVDVNPDVQEHTTSATTGWFIVPPASIEGYTPAIDGSTYASGNPEVSLLEAKMWSEEEK
jgi:PKD repeat protein